MISANSVDFLFKFINLGIIDTADNVQHMEIWRMAKFKILLFEEMNESGKNYLVENGAEIVWSPAWESGDERLLEAIQNISGIIFRAKGRADRWLMDHAPKLKVIARHGVGLDNVDVEEATKKGIRVVYTPLANAEAVAEHAVMMMALISRRILKLDRALRQGAWEVRNTHTGPELWEKTVGIVGFGKIGRRVGEICRRSYNMQILYYDIVDYPEEEERLQARRVPVEELLERSDYVSVNAPLTEDTYHLIGEEELQVIKKGSYLVNTSRGAVIDESALVRALEDGRIAAAGIDVFEDEPPTPDNPLFKIDNAVVTPHIAGQSNESMKNMSMVAVDIIRVLNDQEPQFPAN